MADKSVGDLNPVSSVAVTDNFVIERGGTAYRVTGQVMTAWLTDLADGHGGIQSIAKTGTSGLVDTYTITFADATTTDFTVTNGKGITSITETTSGTAGNGRTHNLKINYNDETQTTVTIQDGLKGNTGAASYLHIKYASKQPTADTDMKDTPDKWIGLYSGTSSSAPASYSSYTWYKFKGEQGDPGENMMADEVTCKYASGESGTIPPEIGWDDSIPDASPGSYIWTRVRVKFSAGAMLPPTTWYSVAYQGVNGTGAVSTVNDKGPDVNNNVQIDATDVPYGSGSNVGSALGSLNSAVSSLSGSKQDKIAISGATTSAPKMLKNTGDGVVAGAVKGTDYGALSFTLSVPVGGWDSTALSKTMTFSSGDENYGKFLASGYAYQIAPAYASLDAYTESQIFVDNVTVDNQITLHCKSVPSAAVTLNVVRMVSA